MRRSGDISFPRRRRNAGHRGSAAGWSRGCGDNPAKPQPGAGVLDRALPGSAAAVPPRSGRVSFPKAAGSARCGNPTGKRGTLPPLPSFLLTASPRRPSGTPRTVPRGADPSFPRGAGGRRLEINGKRSREKPRTAGIGRLRMGLFLSLLSPNKGTGTASVAVKPHFHRRRIIPEGLALGWSGPCVQSPQGFREVTRALSLSPARGTGPGCPGQPASRGDTDFFPLKCWPRRSTAHPPSLSVIPWPEGRLWRRCMRSLAVKICMRIPIWLAL